MKTLSAFHNDSKIKDEYLKRVKDHEVADEIIKGTYWEDGKGCAVGCTIHSRDHNVYQTELGIPKWLAVLEDRIFENLPNSRAKSFPYEFLSSISVGAELEKIKAPFLILVLESTFDKFDHLKYPKVKSSLDEVIALYKRNADPEDFLIAGKNANDAIYSADTAHAAYAAYAAHAAYTAHAAADDADAICAAVYAARATNAAADNADAITYASSYIKFADKLLELLKDCK